MDAHYGRVRLQSLRPLRVACYRVISKSPEDDAFKYMDGWISELPVKPGRKIRKFGFDVPVQEDLQEKGFRGYEVWYAVPSHVEKSVEVTMRDFEGGLYAVMRIHEPFTEPFKVIPEGWSRLMKWVSESHTHELGQHQALEELLPVHGRTELNLYIPVKPRSK